MANNYNITRESFVQSQIFKNILSTGTKMVVFLQQAEFADDQQAEIARKLIKVWSNTCEGFADCEKTKWGAIRYAEIIEDITEFLAKAKALADMALKSNLSKVSVETLHDYFWALFSQIDTIESVFEDLR